jgi:uncharacterized protein (DUF1810 family)
MSTLDRFRDAQDAPHAGFPVALRELQAGRKTSHWIWYVFPQLAAMGRSATAIYYGLADVQEAADYLRDRVLGERLVAAAAAVRVHLTDAGARPAGIKQLMGSDIDAIKLVSSMTLFGHVAKTLYAVDPQPQFATMAGHAEAILAGAAAQGYDRCTYTLEHLRAG